MRGNKIEKTKRRGNLLPDDASIERREWYDNLESNVYRINSTGSGNEPAYLLHQKKLESNNKINPKLLTSESITTTNRSHISLPAVVSTVETVKSPTLIKIHNTKLRKSYKNDTKPSIRTIMILFHGLGSSHIYFKRWTNLFHSLDIELYGVCLPGRLNKIGEDISDHSMQSVAEIINEELSSIINTEILLNKKRSIFQLLFFAHDFGSYLSYEVANLWKKTDLSKSYPIKNMIISSSVSPYEQTKLNMEMKTSNNLISYLPDRDLLRIIKDDLKGIPQTLINRPEVLKRFIPFIRKDFSFLEKYHMDHPNFWSEDDNSLQHHDLENFADIYNAFKVSVPITVLYSEKDASMTERGVNNWVEMTTDNCVFYPMSEGSHDDYLQIEDNSIFFVELIQRLLSS
eukprot:gene5064-7068_t